MSSDLQVTKMCLGCGKLFIAKQHRTKYCSHRCNQIHYATLKRDKKITETCEQTLRKATTEKPTVLAPELKADPAHAKEMLNIKEMSLLCGFSERTLFRLMKMEDFPTIKIGRRKLFNKKKVLDFITEKFGNHERQIKGT